MTVTIIRPNSNAKTQTWFDASYSYVDDPGVEEPDNGDDTVSAANENDVDETFEVGFPDTIDDVDEVTNITIWTLGSILTEANEEPEIWLDLNGATSEQQCAFVLSETWTSNSFDGSWDQSDLDALVLKYRHDGSGKYNAMNIDVCYAVVTYTPTGTGYGHDFIGVPAANIDSVCGVPAANIDNIIGV